MKKYLALILAIVMIVAVFSQTAMALTYAPVSWGSWTPQSISSYGTYYTHAVHRFCNMSYAIYSGSQFLPYNGIYASKTKIRVTAVQNALNKTHGNSIAVTGNVSTATWDKMRLSLSSISNTAVGTSYCVKTIDSDGKLTLVTNYPSFYFDKVNNCWSVNISTDTSYSTWQTIYN